MLQRQKTKSLKKRRILRRIRPKTCLLLTAFILSIHSPISLSADEYITKAKTLEKSGSTEEAISLYRKWLEKNRGESNFAQILLHSAKIDSRIERAKDLLLSYQDNVENSERKCELFNYLGEVSELQGNIEEAARFYHKASEFAAKERQAYYEYKAACMYFESGLFKDAEIIAGTLINSHSTGTFVLEPLFLLSRIYFYTGRKHKGFELLSRLTDSSSTTAHIRPEYILFQYEMAQQEERKDLVKQSKDLLLSLFPESLEANLISGTISGLEAFPAPSRLFQLTKVADAEVEETGSSHSDRVFIQTGSFNDEENARYMLKDLSEIGFEALVREEKRDKGTYYQVLLPLNYIHDKNSSSEEIQVYAQNILTKLKEEGFEGFLVYQ